MHDGVDEIRWCPNCGAVLIIVDYPEDGPEWSCGDCGYSEEADGEEHSEEYDLFDTESVEVHRDPFNP